MTRGSDQRIELELALFTLSEPPQAAAVPVAATTVQAVAPAAPVVRPFVAAPIQPAPQPFMSTPAAPVNLWPHRQWKRSLLPRPLQSQRPLSRIFQSPPRPQTKSFPLRPTSRR